jgi:hypothetical protein
MTTVTAIKSSYRAQRTYFVLSAERGSVPIDQALQGVGGCAQLQQEVGVFLESISLDETCLRQSSRPHHHRQQHHRTSTAIALISIVITDESPSNKPSHHVVVVCPSEVAKHVVLAAHQSSLRGRQLRFPLGSAFTHHITSHHITSHHITSHHITSHHITSHHITSHHITSHHTTSHHITSYHIISHHITSVNRCCDHNLVSP